MTVKELREALYNSDDEAIVNVCIGTDFADICNAEDVMTIKSKQLGNLLVIL